MPPKGRTTRNSNVDNFPVIKQEIISPEKAPENEDEEPLPEIDAFEYECRMVARVRQVLHCEEQFQRGIGILKQAKMKTLSQKRLEVQEGTSEDLNERIKEHMNERNRRTAKIDEWYNLQLTRMQRRVDATKECALASRQTNVVNTQEKLLETLSNKEKDIVSTLVMAKKVAKLTKESMMGKDVEEDCATRTKRIRLNYPKVERYKASLKYPVIVYQLTDKQIAEDLAFFEDALAQKTIERELEKNKNIEALANRNKEAIAKYNFAAKASTKIPLEKQKCDKILKIKIKKKKRMGIRKLGAGTTIVKVDIASSKKTIKVKKAAPTTSTATPSTSKNVKTAVSTFKVPGLVKKTIKKVNKVKKIVPVTTTKVTKLGLPGSSIATDTRKVPVSAPLASQELKEELM